MALFPRLESIFGAPIDKLTAAHIEQAVESKVGEDEQLVWKAEPYSKGGAVEIAMDVAAFANHLGGVIVIGVTEDKATNTASATKPFAASFDDVQRQIKSACNAHIRPFVSPEIRSIEVPGTSTRFATVAVPRSPSAPHALENTSKDETYLKFPVRDGTSTRWLREAELAGRYRERYATRTDIADRLRSIHEAGTSRIAVGGQDHAWVSVAGVPTDSGARGAGPRADADELGFLQGWPWSRGLPNSASIGTVMARHPLTARQAHGLLGPQPERAVAIRLN